LAAVIIAVLFVHSGAFSETASLRYAVSSFKSVDSTNQNFPSHYVYQENILQLKRPENIAANCDIDKCSAEISTGLDVEVLKGTPISICWKMEGATAAASPTTGINQIRTYVFNEGVTFVHYTATDNLGHAVTCTFSVVVTDKQAPEISAPEHITISCNDRVPSPHRTLQAFLNAGGTASDNCSLNTVTFILESEQKSNSFCPYTLARTYQIADFQGNIGQAKQFILVEKRIDPVSIEPQEKELNLKSVTANTITSTSIGGNWNEGTSWEGGTVPLPSDDVIIANGATISMAGNQICNNLNINGTLNCGGNTLQVSGSWVNNGAFNAGTGTVEFAGISNATISGQSETVFKNFRINKGVVGSILQINKNLQLGGNITFSSGLMQINNVVTVHCTSNTGFTIENGAGIMINGGTFTTGQFSINNNGLFKIDNGTANIGSSSGKSIVLMNNGIFDINGGTVNVAGSLEMLGGTADISGGTINLNAVGRNNSATATLDLSLDSKFTMNAGTINFLSPKGGGNFDVIIRNGLGGVKKFTAGAFNFGDGTTDTYKISSAVPFPNITSTANTNLEFRMMPTATGTFTFPLVNSSGNAMPATMQLTGGTVSAGAYIDIKTTGNKHPDNKNSTNFLNRYWNVTTNGITNPIYNFTATYANADIAGNEAGIAMGAWTGSKPWVKYAIANAASNTITATEVTGTSLVFAGIANDPPTVDITNGASVTICNGSMVTLRTTVAGDPVITFSWSPATGLSATNIPNPIASPTATTTYTVTISDGNGFTANDTITVTVNHTLTASAEIIDPILTLGGTAKILITPEGGTPPYTFYFQGLPSNQTGVFTGILGSAEGTEYNWSVSDALNCADASGTITVTEPYAVENNLTLKSGMGILGNETFASSGTWICPPGVTSIIVECWGGGGGGGGNTSLNDGAGGGGGGGYSRSQLTVIPNTIYTVTVGSGGTSGTGNGASGGDSWFNTTGSILARGGSGGYAPVSGNGGNGGNGGVLGTYNLAGYIGGNGGFGRNNNSNNGRGGPGGSSAGSGENGISGSNPWTTITAGAAPVGGGIGGNGGDEYQNGNQGGQPGGGGGGSGERQAFGSNRSGGNGANGQVINTYPDCVDPTQYNVIGGGSYCSGGSGVAVGLSNSESGITYQLCRGVATVGTPVNGTGGVLSFGNHTVAGTYTVAATRTNGGCSVNMTGSAVITIIAPTATIDGTTGVCHNATPPNITFTGVNGIEPYTFTYTMNGGTNQTITTTAGNSVTLAVLTTTVGPLVYSLVSAKDANNCTQPATGSATITVNPIPVMSNTNAKTICSGKSVELALTSVVSSSYSWIASPNPNVTGESVNAQSSATISDVLINTTTTVQTVMYNVTPTSTTGNCVGASQTVTITVYPPLNPGSINEDTRQFCVGGRARIGGTHSPYAPPSGGSGNRTIVWQKDEGCTGTWVDIANTDSTSYTPVAPLVTTCYRRKVIDNICGEAYSGIKKFEIYPDLVSQDIIRSPSNAEVCAGTNISATFINGSGGVPSLYTDVYSYSTNGGANWTSYTPGNSINTGALVGVDVVQIRTRRESTGVAGCDYGTYKLEKWTVLPLPIATINGQTTVCQGVVSQIFSTQPGMSNYTWSISNGTITSGGSTNQVTATWNSPGTQTISVYYTNGKGCTSLPVNYEVFVYPTPIVTPPANQVYCHNNITAPINLSGTPTGVVFDISGGASIGLTDQTGVTAIPSFTTTTGAATITLTPRANGCTGSSETFTITVQSVPTPGVIADDQYVCFGGSTVRINSVTDGTGDGNITYRWERSVAPFTVWTTISGVNTAYHDPGYLAFTTRFRRITVSTLNGVACESNDASNPVTLTIQNVAVTAGSIGNNQTICYNDSPVNLVSTQDGTATAGAIVTYEWQRNSVTIPGETGAGLNISTPHTSTTIYRRRTIATFAGNSCVSEWTVAVTITVINAVSPGSIAANQTICNGATPSPLTSVDVGTSPGSSISYIWEQSTNAGGNWIPITGATGATYTLGTLTTTTWYRRTTVATMNSKSCYSVPTNTVIITVQAVVNPGSIGAAQIICYGATPPALTSVTPATGSGKITYQWEYSIDNGATWPLVTGATALGYAPGALTQTTWYRRIATSKLDDNACSAASAHVIITVQGQLVAPVAAANQTICYNTAPAQLNRTNATGGSGSFTYQWQSSTDNLTFTNIGGATGPIYQPPALIVTTYYRVIATSIGNPACGSINSNVVTISVSSVLVAPEICCSQVVCWGAIPTPLVMSVPVSGGSGSYSYQWQRSANGTTGWQNIGTNLPTYTPPANNYYYRLIVTDIICSITVTSTNIVQVSTAADLTGSYSISTSPSGPYCPGSTFKYTIKSANLSVLWGQYIRYFWNADPTYIYPETGGPVGSWSWSWPLGYEAEINFQVLNPTASQVTTTITVLPTVYNSNGDVYCNLEAQYIYPVIRPFMLQCPSDITANNTPGSCSAQVAVPNIQWVTNSCTATVNWTMSGATTGSGTGNMGNNRIFNVGETTVSYSSTLNGQTTSCSFKVIVLDNQPPVIQCPDNISQPVVSGCRRVVSYAAPVVSDCSTYTVEQTAGLPSGSAFPVGTTTNTFVATDAAGNTSDCSFTVTITDSQAPEFTFCPENISINTDPGVCTATFTPDPPVVVDNCEELLNLTWVMAKDGVTLGESDPTGINFMGNTTFSPGVTTITYTAIDPGGNTADCEFTVTVTDNEAPSFVFCPSGYNQAVDPGECFATVITANPEPFDNCGISSLTWVMTGATTFASANTGAHYIGTYPFNVGTTHVVYTLTDNSTPAQTANCSFDVVITDNIPPTIACPVNQTKQTDLGVCTYTVIGAEFNPTVTDNCTNYTLSNSLTGGPTLAGYVFPIGTTIVRWVVIDAGGTLRECSFDITIEDNQDPAIVTCAPPQTADADENCQAAVPDLTGLVTVSDNCTQTGNFTITQSPVAGTFVGVGITTIAIKVEDEEGNLKTCSTSFTVTDNTAPVFANCPASPIILSCNPATLPNAAMAIANAGTVTDNCNVNPTLTAIGASVSNTGCAYSQSWTVTASDGTNTAQCVVVFEWFQDTDLPVITTAASNGDLGCNPTITPPTFTGTDNCEGNFTPNVTTAGPTNTGCAYTQTWTANYTDACGNTALPVSITYTWTDDNTDPGITCPPSIPANVVVNSGTSYVHSGTAWDATATDNCGSPVLSFSFTGDTPTPSPMPNPVSLNGITFNQGTTVVTWTATDACGKTALCSFTVEVLGQADIAVAKTLTSPTVGDSISANDLITYTITVTNIGPAASGEIVLTDAIPSEILNPEYSLDGTTNWLPWLGSTTITNLANGASTTIFMRGTVGCPVDKKITNTAVVAMASGNPIADPNPNNNTSTVETGHKDNTPPTFTPPANNFDFCVEDIYEAVFNENPIDPDIDDLTYPRPDYYIFEEGFKFLNLPSFSDNCALAANPISWSIDFGNNGSIDLMGTGQLEDYIPPLLVFPDRPVRGIKFPLGTNRIIYRVTDATGNYLEQTVFLEVVPRPTITKNF
jgi:hypothetical protein